MYYSQYSQPTQQSQVQAMQYNPMYNQAVQQNQYQQNQYPQMQQPLPPQQMQQGKFGSNPTYDFVGKRVGSFQEVKECAIPLDGKPMIFIDDENNKLYFKFLDGNGNQTLQSFLIQSDNATETKKEVQEKPVPQQPQIDTNMLIAKIDEFSKSFVSIDDFTRLRKEFESFKEGLM